MKVVPAVVAMAVLLGADRPTTMATPNPSGPWVIEEGPSYSGPRGQNLPGGAGEHFVNCVPASDLTLDRAERERWRDVVIPAEHAYDDTYRDGTPCPSSRIRLFSDDCE
jgi:hypothetical protein